MTGSFALPLKSAALLPAELTAGLNWWWGLQGNVLFDDDHPAV